MLRPARLILALATAAAIPLAPAVARSQTVAASGQAYPDRILRARTSQETNLGSSTRPPNLNPFGVNYADCTEDMTLRFNLIVSGFAGQSVQVWATRSGDCTAGTARAIGASAATCWLVSQGYTGLNASSTTPEHFDVRVQDLVGPQNAPPYPPVLVQEGASACTQQPSFVGVPMTLWFLPVDSAGTAVGTAYKYPVSTDLVGPPAPTGITWSVGDTLFFVNWTSNVDSDTAGYDIFIDPIPGKEGIPSVVPDAGPTCPSAAPPVSNAGGSDSSIGAAQDAQGEGSTDAAVNTDATGGTDAIASTDAAATTGATCQNVTGGGTCGDPVLASSIVQIGTSVTPADDSGTSAAVAGNGGGIAVIPSANIIGANATTGVTISDRAAGSYTITGLKNGTANCAPKCDYTVVVAAVDTSGNVGPPSIEVCDYPALVKDFWQQYRQDGGQAGGGFCALGVVGAPVGFSMALAGVGAAFVAAVRRRPRRR